MRGHINACQGACGRTMDYASDPPVEIWKAVLADWLVPLAKGLASYWKTKEGKGRLKQKEVEITATSLKRIVNDIAPKAVRQQGAVGEKEAAIGG